MNRRQSRTVFNRVAALILMVGACVPAARLFGQKPPAVPPATRPAIPRPDAKRPAKPAVVPASAPAAAMPSGPHLSAGPSFTSADGKSLPKFPRIDVAFNLIGADGKPVQPNASDLQLFAQNKQIAIATGLRRFDQTGYGVASILAIDASGSMRGAPLNAIHASIAKFVGQARPQDQVGVVTFADDTLMDVPFNHTQSQMTAELQTVKARGTTTHLWDGLLFALSKYTTNGPARRLLVVISDGHDEGSLSQLPAVIQRAKDAGVVVSAIGLTRDHGQYLHYLQELAAATGGSYRRAMSAADLEGLIQEGLAAQHATPVASFDAKNWTGVSGSKQMVELRWLPGRVSATTSVQVPKLPVPPVIDRLWLWGLGGCFVAGIILLAVSWRSSRKKPMPVEPFPATGPTFNQPPAPPAAPYSPLPASALEPFDRPATGTPRSPTLDESEYFARPASKPYVPTATPEMPRVETLQEQGSTQAPAPVRNKARSVTQLAGVFDAPPQGPYAWLQITTGDLAGTGVAVSATDFSIGALSSNHLTLSGDPTISGRHARLLWEAGILKIEDSGSTNGTFLNGLKLETGRYVVRPGDEIRVGKAVLIASPA